jgi:hypothetical protein
MKAYLLILWGDCEPDMRGPFATADQRDTIAREVRREYGTGHGLFRIDVGVDGTYEASVFRGAESEGGSRDTHMCRVWQGRC